MVSINHLRDPAWEYVIVVERHRPGNEGHIVTSDVYLADLTCEPMFTDLQILWLRDTPELMVRL